VTQADDGDFSKTARKAPSARARWVRRVLAGTVLLVLFGLIAGWVMRKSIAGQVLADWCAGRNLACSARFDELGLDGAAISDLTIKGQGQTAFEAPGYACPAGVAWVFHAACRWR
jgi:hypothetical protein